MVRQFITTAHMEQYLENTVYMTEAACAPGESIHQRVISARYWLGHLDREGSYAYYYVHSAPPDPTDWKNFGRGPDQVRWVFSDHYLAIEFRLHWC